jgi:hypothetical protein
MRLAAVQVPAPSLMLDDGEVERRVRLVRPMERISFALDALAATHWREANEATFAASWTAELGQLPTFSESEFHIITGLLLPIWRRLPDDGCRVYRLATDDGERVIGRQVSPAWIASAFDMAPPALAPADAFSTVLDEGRTIHLADGLSLRRSMVMHAARVELLGFTEGMVPRLKALGLISEIISWKLRLFVPVGPTGHGILGVLLERHPLARVAQRAAA